MHPAGRVFVGQLARRELGEDLKTKTLDQRQDTRLAAEALLDNLLKMIRGEDVTSPRIPISLVVRGSCGGGQS